MFVLFLQYNLHDPTTILSLRITVVLKRRGHNWHGHCMIKLGSATIRRWFGGLCGWGWVGGIGLGEEAIQGRDGAHVN